MQTASTVLPSTSAEWPDLSALFSPNAIAVVGASDNPKSPGGQAMRYLTTYGYSGRVVPINPKRETVLDLACTPSIAELDVPCDVALIAVAAPMVADTIRQCGNKNIRFAVILSAGFREAGAEGEQLEADLINAIADSGVRVVGPNCMGVLNVAERIHTGFGQGFGFKEYTPGPLAMVTQSGGYGFTLLRNGTRAGLGFNYAASVGNSVDLNVLDFIDYFLKCDDVKVVAAFIEGISDGRRLLELGREALRIGKPILVWKAGVTSAGRVAAASHTASLAAEYPLYRAAFQRGGYVELEDFEDLVDVSNAFVSGWLPKGHRVAIVSGSGGAGVIAADRFTQAGLELPQYTAQTVARLNEELPALSGKANPLDISGGGSRDGRSLSNVGAEAVLADPNIDMVLVRSGQTTGNVESARALSAMRQASGKPVLVATVAEDHLDGKAVLDADGVPWFVTVGRAARAARAMADFSVRRQKIASEQPFGDRPFPPPQISLPTSGRFLSELKSREILERYGIRFTRQVFIAADDICLPGEIDLTFPVAVKANSPDIPHKSEADAIRLGIPDSTGVYNAAREVIDSARAYAPDAEIDGVLVQEMARGIELIAGAVNDECFGPVVLCGMGGVLAEVMQDVAHGFAPLGIPEARDMLESLRGAKLLQGFRGQPPADLGALADLMVRIGWLIADQAGRIESLDINPVFVRGGTIVAADALIVLKPEE